MEAVVPALVSMVIEEVPDDDTQEDLLVAWQKRHHFLFLSISLLFVAPGLGATPGVLKDSARFSQIRALVSNNCFGK